MINIFYKSVIRVQLIDPDDTRPLRSHHYVEKVQGIHVLTQVNGHLCVYFVPLVTFDNSDIATKISILSALVTRCFSTVKNIKCYLSVNTFID